MGSAEAKAFIARVGPIIQKKAKERGYKVCSPIIAQAVIESRYGESGLAKYHNYFGLKCGSSWKGPSVNMKTKEEYNSQLVNIRDNFRVFPDLESGIDGYFDFISTKRYANLKSAETPEEYLKRIKADGYATSSSYVQTNMDCIRRYEIDTKYDWAPVVYPEPARLLKRGMSGEDVKWLQKRLSEKGYSVGAIDGIYGPKVEEGVRRFQADVFCDGICGPLTLGKLKK